MEMTVTDRNLHEKNENLLCCIEAGGCFSKRFFYWNAHTIRFSMMIVEAIRTSFLILRAIFHHWKVDARATYWWEMNNVRLHFLYCSNICQSWAIQCRNVSIQFSNILVYTAYSHQLIIKILPIILCLHKIYYHFIIYCSIWWCDILFQFHS